MTDTEIIATMRRHPVGNGFPPSNPLSAITAYEHQLGAFKVWCISWTDVATIVIGFAVSKSEPRAEQLILAYHNAQSMLADPTGPQPLEVRS